jgi:hypothetical protein
MKHSKSSGIFTAGTIQPTVSISTFNEHSIGNSKLCTLLHGVGMSGEPGELQETG